MERDELTILLIELEKAITDIHGPDWGKSNINEISNNYIELCYRIEHEFTKDEEIIEAIYSFKVENNLIPEEENSSSSETLGKRDIEEIEEEYTDNIEAPTKRNKSSFDSITKAQFNNIIAKATYGIMTYFASKVLFNVSKDEKDRVLASIGKEVDSQKSDARALFDSHPDKAENILNKYKQNIKIVIGIIFEQLREKFPDIIKIDSKTQISYLEAAKEPINWDLSDINVKSSYELHNEHYEQQKKSDKQELKTARNKFSYDSIPKFVFKRELSKAFYTIKFQTIKKVLSNLPQVEKNEALASIEAKVAIQKSAALTIFDTFPHRGEDISKKFKQNIKIEIGIKFGELKEKFPNVLVVANKAHRSYFEAANHQINWDLSDISESKSYVFHNEEHYEQQKKFTKTISKFFQGGTAKKFSSSELLRKFLSSLDIEQDKKDKILATIEEDITEAQTVAKKSFTPDNDQQNNKALADFKIKVQSIIIEKINNFKIEINSQSTSNTKSMNKLIDDFIAKISTKLYRYKSIFEKYTNLDDSEGHDNVEIEETNDSGAEESLSNGEEKISGDKLSGQDSSKKEEFKLVHQENSDTNHNDIIVKIQMIEEFYNLPELLTRFFTRFKEFVENFPKAMAEFLSCAKNKFIIISGENLEMGSHAKSEEIVYKGENLPDSKPKILVGDIPIPFEFTPERSSMDISSLIQENSVNGLINEMFNAREIFF